MNNLARHLASGASRAARAQKPVARPHAAYLSARHNSSDATSSSSGPTDGLIPHEEDSVIEDSIKVMNSMFPDLMKPDVLMDLHESADFPPSRRTPYRNRVVVRNDPSMFLALQEQLKKSAPEGERDDRQERASANGPMTFLHLTPGEIARLYRYPVIRRRVVQQTGKGKIARQHVVMVVGNQNGLVGIGEGKADEGQRAAQSALISAVRNMDYVERFEDRTVWTQLESKFGSTRIILRPRPVGFGLHCNPNIYQVLKAAGIKDVSAKVWGSRNPLQVIRTLSRMLMPGYTPSGMGNGIGGEGRRMDKGYGLRAKDELERERGRKLVPIRI